MTETERERTIPESWHASETVEEYLDYLIGALLLKATQNASQLAPNLEIPGLIIMLFINSHGPASPATVVNETGIDKSVVVTSLQTLRIHGHVTTMPNEYNRGHTLYSTTRRGIKHLEQIRTHNVREYAQVLSTWTDSEVDQFLRALKSIVNGIGNLGKPAR